MFDEVILIFYIYLYQILYIFCVFTFIQNSTGLVQFFTALKVTTSLLAQEIASSWQDTESTQLFQYKDIKNIADKKHPTHS